MSEPFDVIIVGGGIAGLATRLRAAAPRHRLPRPRASARARRRDPHRADRRVHLRRGARRAADPEAGRHHALQGARARRPAVPDIAAAGRVHPPRAGRCIPLPESSMLGIPRNVSALAATRLFSLAGQGAHGRRAVRAAKDRRRRRVDRVVHRPPVRPRGGDLPGRAAAGGHPCGRRRPPVDARALPAVPRRRAEVRQRAAGVPPDPAAQVEPTARSCRCRAVSRKSSTRCSRVLPRDSIALNTGVRVGRAPRPATRSRSNRVSVLSARAVDRLRARLRRRPSSCDRPTASWRPSAAEIPYASSATVDVRAIGARTWRTRSTAPASSSRAWRRRLIMAGSWISSKWRARAPGGPRAAARVRRRRARPRGHSTGRDDDLIAASQAELVRLHGITGRPAVRASCTAGNARTPSTTSATWISSRRSTAGSPRCPDCSSPGPASAASACPDCVADARRTAADVAAWVASNRSERP